MSKLVLTVAALALSGAASVPAMAQDTDGGSNVTLFGYNVNGSIRARVQPTYEGSDDYKVGPAGSISLSRPGAARVFSAPDDGISISLVGNETMDAGITGRIRGGRDNDDDLRGMEKIDYAVEAGGFVNWWAAPSLRLRLEVRRGFGGHEGVVADLGADFVAREGRWTVAAGPRISYADDEYTQTYFGVTALEAIASPLIATAYDPEGGIRHAGVQASADYQWNPRLRVTFDASYRKLMGDAADSPLVKQLGSEDQFGASAGVRYAFGQ